MQGFGDGLKIPFIVIDIFIIRHNLEKWYNNYVYKMLKGEKIMRRERLGFKSDEGLIVKSPETEIVAKVELQNNGTAVASLMKWDEVIELDEQANEENHHLKRN